MLKIRTAFILLVTLISTGCSRRAEPVFGSGPNGERTLVLEVSNQNFNEATIYVLRYGDRIRAGNVIGKSRATLRVRWASSAPLRVEIRLLADETCITREVSAEPGDVVSVEVPSDLRLDPDCQRRN